VVVVCLDDANYLVYENKFNDLLYILLRLHEVHENTRIGVIAISSDMTLDLKESVDPRVLSIFRATDIYYPPYGEDEMRAILSNRAKQGFYPGVLSPKMLDLAVEKTFETADIRTGIDLLKQAGLNAERDARPKIVREDIQKAFGISKLVHLRYAVYSLKKDEKRLLGLIAGMENVSNGVSMSETYKAVKASIKIGYSTFYKSLKKFDTMRLVDVNYLQGRGRTRMITLRYEPDRGSVQSTLHFRIESVRRYAGQSC
jgi:cell division control protein 6